MALCHHLHEHCGTRTCTCQTYLVVAFTFVALSDATDENALCAGPSGAEQEEPAQPKFQAFVGQGMRLDGKPSSRSSEPAQSSQPPVQSSSRKTGVHLTVEDNVDPRPLFV